MRVVIVGATGLVGREMLRVVEQRNLPVEEVLVVASQKSVGKKIHFKGRELTCISMEQAIAEKPDIALFSAGGEVSKSFAPRFAEAGIRVIDNSSAWRMDPEVKLVVPEINGHMLSQEDMIIANPNCSTIQLVMVLHPLNKRYGIKRVVVSTYQSISGTGVKAVEQLENERTGKKGEMAYPYPIDKNCLPHCDVFMNNAYTREEMKLTNESKKILADNSVHVTATAVRVPVVGGHSESVNIEMEQEFLTSDVRKLLSDQPGIVVQDNPDMNVYPMPLYSQGKDEVFVGRIRRDLSQVNTLNCWIVSDNLRKGAATNAVQIAELYIR
jgi:aspartate-semialdehyde dehydrogenase